MTWQRAAKWFRRPHGAPSGVCTGQRNPALIQSKTTESGTTPLTPCLWKEFTNSCSTHLSKECSTVDSSEMRKISIEVELLCYYSETSCLITERNNSRTIYHIILTCCRFRPDLLFRFPVARKDSIEWPMLVLALSSILYRKAAEQKPKMNASNHKEKTKASGTSDWINTEDNPLAVRPSSCHH